MEPAKDKIIYAAHRITKRWPGVVALDGVDFHVYAGRLNAVVGENGAGKSTLMNILCGVYDSYEGELRLDDHPIRFASTADVMPLLHDNRMIVKSGVRLVEKTDNLGLQALIAAAGIRDKKITATDVAFMIAPRINASGRMGDPALAVELLLCEDEQRAQEIAAELNSYNVRKLLCEHNDLY